jgi:hypothetical protein
MRAGAIIGKCENILVLIFVLTESFTALAVVFAAESIIAREYHNDFYPIFVIVGTLVNFTYSLLVSISLLYFVN